MPPSARKSPGDRPAGPAPSAAALHEAALLHLSRFAATEAGLLRVLLRRIDRWSRAARDQEADPDAVAAQAAQATAAAREVVARLAASGAVDDAAFAESRARRLIRAGRSRRAVGAHLASKGVAAETARAVLPDDPDTELAAALAFARRRRIGPFRAPAVDPDAIPDAEGLSREYAAFARAGFPQSVAGRALRMDAETALALVERLRRT